MVSEKELRSAMSSTVESMAVQVVDWTTTIDDRCVPATIGFFVELASDQGMYALGRIHSLADETRFPLAQSLVLHSLRNMCSMC